MICEFCTVAIDKQGNQSHSLECPILRIAYLEAENKALREALFDHHLWHQNLGEVGLHKDENGEWIEINMSLEYSDSSLCEKTEAALAAKGE